MPEVACSSTHPQTNTYLRWGFYALHLERFFRVMPPSARYIIVHSEAFFAETAGVMAEVVRHLGLPPHDYAAHDDLATPFNGAGHCAMPPGRAPLRGVVEPLASSSVLAGEVLYLKQDHTMIFAIRGCQVLSWGLPVCR